MNLADFQRSLQEAEPGAELPAPLKALWFAARGEWDAAHRLVQNDPAPEAAWVHAHLHRVEGDLANARYWYRQAGRKPASGPLDDERRVLVEALLAASA